MHPIRRQILSNLILARELPFSKLKPQDIESNIFMYHLKLLISEGLVRKLENKKYGLTNEGIRLAGGLSWKTFNTRIQPRIVTKIVCKNKGKFVLFRSKRQPALDMVGFPYGKLHMSETVNEAARRELEEKTGLTADLVHRGDLYITLLDGDEVLSQTLVHLFFAKNPKGELVKGVDGPWDAFWGNPEKISKSEKAPWFDDIYKLFKNPPRGFFFREFVYVV